MLVGDKGRGARDDLWAVVRIARWVGEPCPGVGKSWRRNRLGAILLLAMEVESKTDVAFKKFSLKGTKETGQREA